MGKPYAMTSNTPPSVSPAVRAERISSVAAASKALSPERIGDYALHLLGFNQQSLKSAIFESSATK